MKTPIFPVLASFLAPFSRTKSVRLFFYLTPALALTLVLQGCISSGAPTQLSYYDLGPAAPAKKSENSSTCQLPPLYLADIAAPSSLDSDAMLYRLLYVSDQQSNTYASYRWSMAPAQLLKQRIKAEFANNGISLINNGVSSAINKPAAMQLRLELDDFSHYFSDAQHSYSQLQLRASLIQGRMLLAQTTLHQQANATTADAPGGALAMREATDQLISELGQWLCKKAKP